MQWSHGCAAGERIHDKGKAIVRWRSEIDRGSRCDSGGGSAKSRGDAQSIQSGHRRPDWDVAERMLHRERPPVCRSTSYRTPCGQLSGVWMEITGGKHARGESLDAATFKSSHPLADEGVGFRNTKDGGQRCLAARLRAQKKANEAEGGGGVICTGGCFKQAGESASPPNRLMIPAADLPLDVHRGPRATRAVRVIGPNGKFFTGGSRCLHVHAGRALRSSKF